MDAEIKTCELYVQIPDDDTVAQIQLGKEGKLIKFAVEKFVRKSAKNESNENNFLKSLEMNRAVCILLLQSECDGPTTISCEVT